MEEIEVNGLVIREVMLGEADKLITLMTAEHGKILVSGKGVKSLKSRHATSCQLFSYSTFLLRKTKKYFYIADSDLNECFFGIRYDIERVALANYICDIVCDLSLENVADPELLRLTLNTLYALSNKKELCIEQIKAAFEFRAASVSGFMPTLDQCGICSDVTFSSGCRLDVMNGRTICGNCAKILIAGSDEHNDGTALICPEITSSVLAALRYTNNSSLGRYLSFFLEEEELEIYAFVCEAYLLSHLEHGFKSLDYYKKLKFTGMEI